MNITNLLQLVAVQSQEQSEIHSDNARYSRQVNGYDFHLGISMKKVIDRLKDKQDHPIVALDVMCGGGNTVRELNLRYRVNAFGVDILNYPDYQNNYFSEKFIITSSDNLSMIPDESIDLILNLNGYTEFENEMYDSISEALRVLRPGGEMHVVPFVLNSDFGDAKVGIKAIEDFEKEKGIKLSYEITRELLPFGILARNFFNTAIGQDPCMVKYRSPSLHLEKPKLE